MRSKGHPVAIFLAALLISGLCGAHAEDTCLPTPNARAAQGTHWYYRTDPISQNKCWHLRTDEQIGQPQPIQQNKSGSAAGTQAAADPPLPRPAPNGLRRQRSGSVPTDPIPSLASGGTAATGFAQGEVELRGGSGGTLAWPLPSAFPTNPTVWGETPTGIATAPTTSDDASPQRGVLPPAAADTKAAVNSHPDEKPSRDRFIQQVLEPKSAKADKETIAPDENSYKEWPDVILILIVAVFVVVATLIGVVTIRLARAHKAAAVIRQSSDLPAHAEKSRTNDDAGRALRELIQLLEPYEAPFDRSWPSQ